MHKLAIALSVGAAALFLNVEAKASDTKASGTVASGTVAKDAAANTEASQATDISSRHRRRHVRYYRSYQPRYAPAYGYYQQPAYRQPYYQPGPSISFGFGGGRGYDGYRGW